MSFDTIRRIVNPVVTRLKDNAGAGTELTMGAIGEGVLGRSGTTIAPTMPKDSSVHGIVQVGTTDLECWFMGAINGTAVTTAVVSKGVIRATPVCLAQTRKLDMIGFNVNTTPGTSTALGRAGIYRSTNVRDNCYPGALLVDGGEYDCTSTGFKVTALSNVVLDAGEVYWFATFFGGTGTAPTCDLLTNNTGPVIAVGTGATPASLQHFGYVTATVTYGALPLQYPIATAITAGALVAVAVRFSA
jgi:hypothetical protein